MLAKRTRDLTVEDFAFLQSCWFCIKSVSPREGKNSPDSSPKKKAPEEEKQADKVEDKVDINLSVEGGSFSVRDSLDLKKDKILKVLKHQSSTPASNFANQYRDRFAGIAQDINEKKTFLQGPLPPGMQSSFNNKIRIAVIDGLIEPNHELYKDLLTPQKAAFLAVSNETVEFDFDIDDALLEASSDSVLGNLEESEESIFSNSIQDLSSQFSELEERSDQGIELKSIAMGINGLYGHYQDSLALNLSDAKTIYHGSHVVGVIAGNLRNVDEATRQNSFEIVPVSFLGHNPDTLNKSFESALDFVYEESQREPIHILSISYATAGSEAILEKIEKLLSTGMLIVVAAGNDQRSLDSPTSTGVFAPMAISPGYKQNGNSKLFGLRNAPDNLLVVAGYYKDGEGTKKLAESNYGEVNCDISAFGGCFENLRVEGDQDKIETVVGVRSSVPEYEGLAFKIENPIVAPWKTKNAPRDEHEQSLTGGTFEISQDPIPQRFPVGSRYEQMVGTSQAAPQIAAVSALLWLLLDSDGDSSLDFDEPGSVMDFDVSKDVEDTIRGMNSEESKNRARISAKIKQFLIRKSSVVKFSTSANGVEGRSQIKVPTLESARRIWFDQKGAATRKIEEHRKNQIKEIVSSRVYKSVLGRGFQQFYLGRYEHASELFEGALGLASTSEASYMLAFCKSNVGQDAQAISLFEQAVSFEQSEEADKNVTDWVVERFQGLDRIRFEQFRSEMKRRLVVSGQATS